MTDASPLRLTRVDKRVLLIIPVVTFVAVFFVIPVGTLFAIAFNPSQLGVIGIQQSVTLDNFVKVFTTPLYYNAVIHSLLFGISVALLTLLLGYPLAYVVAKTENPTHKTLFLILILIPMQLDMVVRLYGLITILGDNGLINATLVKYGILNDPLPLMYNAFGTILGLGQYTLPFMVLSLYGIIENIDPSLEESARGLGANRLKTFTKITLPLSTPGILTGTLLVFALSISSYVVPVIMGGWTVAVMPMHIYQQISEMGYWQFGSALAVVLFVISLTTIFLYYRFLQRYLRGLLQ